MHETWLFALASQGRQHILWYLSLKEEPKYQPAKEMLNISVGFEKGHYVSLLKLHRLGPVE